MNGLADEARLWGHARFLHEPVKSQQCLGCGAGVDGCKRTWVTGDPGLEQRQRFTAAQLADDDAVWLKAHRGAHQAGQVLLGRRPQVNGMATTLSPEFAQLLEDEYAFAGIDLPEQGVGNRGLARAGAANDQDVAPASYASAQEPVSEPSLWFTPKTLILGVEIFNRPSKPGRVEGVLLTMNHAFEMLLKAVVFERGAD